MGWRLTRLSSVLLSLSAGCLARPSLLGHVDGGHHHGHGTDHRQQRQQATNGVTVVSVEPLLVNPDGSFSYRYQLSDGTFAFGNGFSDGEVTGGYGYRDTEGKDVTVDFTAGKVGFLPTGPHLPAGGSQPATKSFSFSFNSDNYNREETADSEGTVKGNYNYVDADGVERTVNYRAGAGIGFVPEADFFPVDPELEAAFASFGQKMPSAPSAAASSVSLARQQPPPPAAAGMAMDPAYYFEYHGADGSRVEDANSAGEVAGSYSYRTAGGSDIEVRYKAGPDTGFVIENQDQLTAALEGVVGEPAEVVAKPYSGEPAEVEFMFPDVDPATMQLTQAYQFGFRNSDHSRDETADVAGNVRGSYSFRNDEGQDIEVQYTAGADTGFVVSNLEEVLAKSAPREGETAAASSGSVIIEAGSGDAGVSIPSGQYFSPPAEELPGYGQGQASEDSGHVFVYEEEPVEVYDHQDVPAETYVHEEIAAETYVHEEIPAETYIHEEIAAEPYIHEEIAAEPYVHEEIAAEPYVHEEIAAEAYNHEEIAAEPYVHEDVPAESYAAESSAPSLSTLYGAPPLSVAASQPAPAVLPGAMVMNPVYNFAYQADDSSRSEDANPDTGLITGQYSYTNPEGNEITVVYRSGADIGFVIENQDDLDAGVRKATEDGAKVAAAARAAQPVASASPLPVAGIKAPVVSIASAASSPGGLYSAPPPPPPPAPAPAASSPSGLYSAPPISISPPSGLYDAPLPSYSDNTIAASAPEVSVKAAPTMMVMDQSFQFGFDEDDLSFSESSDVVGERTGSYRYISPEGESVEVRYTAGKNGFVILNPEDVLPMAPVHVF